MAGETPSKLVHSVKTESKETAIEIATMWMEQEENVMVYPASQTADEKWCIQILEWE